MIIVLTLGRSGSSMLMQTLKILGLEVVGKKFGNRGNPEAQRRHQQQNPKGYFEAPGIFSGGPSSIQFKSLLTENHQLKVCKMDLRTLYDQTQLDHWKDASNNISTVLISYRNPSEQAHSEYMESTAKLDGSKRLRFKFINQFLYEYISAYGDPNDFLGQSLPDLDNKRHHIDYAEIVDPESYVDRLCKAANINATQCPSSGFLGAIAA